MVMKGETVRGGAENPGTPIAILHSGGGFYFGYLETDGSPYSRESGYYRTYGEAVMAQFGDEISWREDRP